MARLELTNVCKQFRGPRGQEIDAVNAVTLAAQPGELIAIVGPSGAGKTTLLRMIAGLEDLTAGTISLDGIALNVVAPHLRDMAMVFQNAALYPHLTVAENMALGLKLRGVPPEEIERRVNQTAQGLGLHRHLDRLPRSISGGERQRVALGRAMVRRPKVFLFDEPLSSLDTVLRGQMRMEIAKLQSSQDSPMVYVTHDQAEAMALGQRIAVMKDGVVQQIATAATLYNNPANMFVAAFIGSPPMNIFRGQVSRRNERFTFLEHNFAGAAGTRFEVPLPDEQGARLAAIAEGNVVMGLRPEKLSLTPAPHAIIATVRLVEQFGPETHVHLGTGGHDFILRTQGTVSLSKEERVSAGFDLSDACFFNPVSEKPLLF